MHPSSQVAKYREFLLVSARETLSHRTGVVGRLMFYALLILIFSRVWEAAYAAQGAGPGNAADMLWYLAVTEWIILSIPPVHVDIEDDVKSGNLAYHLPRPISYPWMRVADAMGSAVVRLATLGLFGVAFTWFFSGRLPSQTVGFLYVLPLGLLATFVMVVFQVGLGISAFWLQDASPVFWVWQKLSFILGGLIVPLSLYPEWVKKIAFGTPFAATLFGPGDTLLTGSGWHATMTFAALLFWLFVAIRFLNWIYRSGCRTLDINGG